ncbi:MAG: 50S ribosomal protein L17 [Candidatus Omnitrophica bacterium]|nr:50S ribosomal protein L17 [Candidatus Omnitrophota bacterium]
MRHNKKRLQLNRFTSWHKATLKSLVRSLVIYESIKTTLHRAKAVKSLAEKLITLAKANTLSAKREAYKILGDHKLVGILFSEIGPRFSKRVGGYTRIINLARRRGDDAQVVIFELTEQKPKLKKVKKTKADKTELQGDKEIEGGSEASSVEENKVVTETAVKEKPPVIKRPTKKFIGGLRNIFRKKGDSL